MFAEKKHCKCFVWFGSWLNIYSVSQCPPMCAGVRVNLSQYLNVSFAVVFFFLPPAHLKHIQPPSTTFFFFYTGACLPH